MIIKLGDDPQVQAKRKGVVDLGGVDIEEFFVLEFRISLVASPYLKEGPSLVNSHPFAIFPSSRSFISYGCSLGRKLPLFLLSPV